MTQYLLDTNHLSPLVTHGHQLREQVLLRLTQGDGFAIPTPALCEFLFGIQRVPRASANMAEWKRLSANFGYHDVRRRDAEEAANLQVLLRGQGRQLATVDALIAVIALRNEVILLTTDRDFSAVTGLQQENWLVI